MNSSLRQTLFFLCVAVLFCSVAMAEQTVEQPDPHQQLESILHRPIYERWQLRQAREKDMTFSEDLARRFDQMAKWLNDWLNELFRPRSSHARPATSPSLSPVIHAVLWIVGIGVLILFAVALIILIMRIIAGRGGRDSLASVLSREQVAAALNQGNALALAGDQWLDEASRLGDQQDFRAAYRALYLALLSGLHTKGRIDYRRNYTNWVYVNRYRGDLHERDAFADLTDLFDSVWYGLKPARTADMGALRRTVQTLIAPDSPAGGVRAA